MEPQQQQQQEYHTTGNFTALCGSYQSAWLIPGQQQLQRQRYFVEILVLFCHNFGVETLARNKKNISTWLSFDFQNVCMENQRKNRVTLDGAYITIERSPPPPPLHRRQQTTTPGRWRLTASRNNPEAIHPIYTRHQPPECLEPHPKDRLFCSKRTTSSALYSFEFEWRNDSWTSHLQHHQSGVVDFLHNISDCQKASSKMQCVLKTQDMHQNNTLPKICLVGFSHSYYMAYSMILMDFGHFVRWIPIKFPDEITLDLLIHHHQEFQCVKFILAAGQWAAGHPENRPYLFQEFSMKMSRVLYEISNATTTLSTTSPDSSSQSVLGFQVFLRSLHRVPICYVTSICPPKDWRSPTVMDGYTYLVRKMVADVNKTDTIQYIDTSFITTPLWDISRDWNHLPRLVSDVEARYVLAAALGMLPPSAISHKSLLNVVYY